MSGRIPDPAFSVGVPPVAGVVPRKDIREEDWRARPPALPPTLQ